MCGVICICCLFKPLCLTVSELLYLLYSYNEETEIQRRKVMYPSSHRAGYKNLFKKKFSDSEQEWREEASKKISQSLCLCPYPYPANRFSSVQFSHSVVSDSLGPHELQHARPPCPSATAGIHPNSCPLSQWCHPSNYLILCHPLLFLLTIFLSIRVFSNELALRIRLSKYWSFSFNISLSSEHPGLISFRTDWWNLLAVQGTLKSLL